MMDTMTIVQGGSIKTGETVDGVKHLVKSRALVEGDTMIVKSDDPTMSAEQLARHEATHKRIERGEVQLGSTVRQLLKKYSSAQIREIIHLYAEAYGNVNMNAAQVLEEIVCDAMAEMNAFATEQTESLAGEVGRFLRDVKKAAQGGTLEGGQKKNAPGGVKYSIQNTQNMSWSDQIEGALYGKKNIRRNDTLVVGDVAEALVQDGITQRPLAIPLSVITKASSGKDISHSIKRGKLANLASGIKNAPIVIVNPSRNAIVYVTSIKQSGAPILVAFDMDTVFDGDEVHKATSIHLQINVQSMLDNLPQNATVYVQNENELAAVGATNNLRGLAANVKFISSRSIANQGAEVKQKYSRELDSEGNELTEAQQKFFRNSEVRNEYGELIPVYHKTTEEFTVFKRSKLGGETLSNASDASLAATSLIGHWFSDSEDTPFFGDAMKTYLNITKPYHTSLDELAADIGDFASDLETMQEHFEAGQYNMVREAARGYVNWMKWNGYDGLIVNDTETGGTSYVILNSRQAKLTDNENPTGRNDIRHSRELETIEELKKQNELLKKQVDYWHSQTAVTVGERGADKEEVKRLARQLKRDYGSQTEVEDYLQALQWLADNRQNKKAKFADMMQTAENVAREVLDGCRVNVNAEQMETMKELKKFLRGRYINVDESLKEDIGDFGDFKKLNRALHFREDGSGTGVDSLWLELQDRFGEGLFPEDVQNPADQIRHIADTVGSMEAQWVNPVKKAIAQENSGDIGVYYAKKEALTLPVAGVRFPTQLQQSIASSGIVHRFAEKVNGKMKGNNAAQHFPG